MKRIQRQRTKGWRMPEGAVYVGRPSLFGNPWSIRDVREMWPYLTHDQAAQVAVAKYRGELVHGGLLSDYSWLVSEARWDQLSALFDELSPPTAYRPGSIIPLFKHLLRDATALVCWCPLDQPCHADVLIELLEES